MDTELYTDLESGHRLTARLVTNTLDEVFYRCYYDKNLFALVSKTGIGFTFTFVQFRQNDFAEFAHFVTCVSKQFPND